MKVLLAWGRFALAALVCVVAATSRGAEAVQRPNIVLILADDLGWGSVCCYGGTRLQTPNIDRLAKEGRRLRHAYAPGSVCSPTRYALLTGRYFWRTSVKDGKVLPANGPLHIETNRLTIASLAKKQGYRTAVIGKWHLGFGSATKNNWDAPLTPGPLSIGFDYFFGMSANPGNPPQAYLENDRILDGPRPTDQIMNQLTRKATDWIEKQKEPFFLYFAPNAVHEPVAPAAEFKNSPFGKYGDFIHELDATVGRIVAALEKRKVADNTVIVFTSDNGGVVNPRNANASAAMEAGLAICGQLRGGKHSIYEGGFRVPFIIRWPGKVPAGTTCDDIVGVHDIFTTLASIFKTSLPPATAEDSLDVSSSWFGIAKGKPARESVIVQDASAFYAIRQGPWKFIEREGAPTFKSRNVNAERRTTQARKGAPSKDELFNLDKDPSETNNVASEHPEIVRRLRELLTKTRQ